jgi:hypothetical protein
MISSVLIVRTAFHEHAINLTVQNLRQFGFRKMGILLLADVNDTILADIEETSVIIEPPGYFPAG